MGRLVREVEAARSESVSGGRTVLKRLYEVVPNTTLATLALAEGDALPDDGDAEIVESGFVMTLTKIDDSGTKHPMPSNKVAVTAEKWASIGTKGALSELQGSRRVIGASRKYKVYRLFHVAYSTLAKAEGGWTCSGMPVRGELLGVTGMTWRPNEEPVCTGVLVTPQFRKNTARVLAVYESSRGVD